VAWGAAKAEATRPVAINIRVPKNCIVLYFLIIEGEWLNDRKFYELIRGLIELRVWAPVAKSFPVVITSIG
jgi:hypothetical protein